ncbi:hypothetical protein [Quadrisphaera setariae]|uniref:Uncharacterized protein n=1 Tax=Quadrisphaera setariae TaxID=2593304 RepID=A0A5C8Z3S1_9ACTN|nr:hypothetical protein [Quadrisphaera setariae]TXR51556.1 hypothetical protein FMM08_22390 [Quadrisphaera setariae]
MATDGDAPTTDLSRQRTADLLRLSLNAVRALESSGYLPDRHLQRILFLSQEPYIRAVTPLPILRQADASPTPAWDQHRSMMGDSASLTDAEVLPANSMWWRANASAIVEAGILPVSRSGFIVTVLRIDGLAETMTVDIPATSTKGAHREVRHRFQARLAGRVGALGSPETYELKDASVEADYQDLTRQLLGRRSAAVSGGPLAYVPMSNAVDPTS